MKKLFLLSIIFAFTFCKKQYNCHCRTDVTFPSQNNSSYYSNTTKLTKKVSKKQAEAICAREEESINETFIDFFTNNGNWSQGGYNASTKCTVK
ncbi:MAG: hypothetical protein AB7O73_09510 [Bacteroidia bacterium]